MSQLYADTTPILETVFVDLAPDAADLSDIYLQADGRNWHSSALPYPELADWATELAATADAPSP